MVLTRSQAAKQKANQSPQPSRAKVSKQPRKQGAAAVDAPADVDAAAEQQQQQQQQPANGPQPATAKMGGRLAKLKLAEASAGPASHPLSSLPASPMCAPAGGGFSIPAVQQEEVGAVLEQAAAAAQVQQAQREQQQVQRERRPADSGDATSLDRQQPRADLGVASEERDEAVSQPAASLKPQAAGAAAERQAQQQQRAQPPLPQPRAEKLLKPLPDKPLPCDKLPDGPEPVQVEVEYVAREDLQPVEDAAAALEAAHVALASADWVETVKGLNLLRQLIAHHMDACSGQLDVLVPLVLKSVRSLRSSVCKTAIMAAADLYLSYGDALLPLTDVGGLAKPMTSMLAQILLKCSSNDKKFVIEEAQRTLQIMVASLAPAQLLPLLLPYADVHKNPKVRGKAGPALADTAARMAPADVAAFGLPRLLQAAGKLVTDNTPEAREAAKRLIDLLRAAAADPAVAAQLAVEPPTAAPAGPAGEGDAEGEPAAQPTQWELLCRAHLSSSAALAVLKASAEAAA